MKNFFIKTLIALGLLTAIVGINAQSQDISKHYPGIRAIQEAIQSSPPLPLDALTSPPPGGFENIRTPDEWEPTQAVLIHCMWYLSPMPQPYFDLIPALAQSNIHVIIAVKQEFQVQGLKTWLTDQGISWRVWPEPDEGQSVVFVYANPLTVMWKWTRDWGAQTIYYGTQKQAGQVDWRYYHPEGGDDDVPVTIAATLGLSDHLYRHPDLFAEGGNTLFDGFGTMITDASLFENNIDLSRDDIINALKSYCGVTRLIDLPTPFPAGYEFTPYMDMYMKFLDEETILYGIPPEFDGAGQNPWDPTIRQAIFDNIMTIKNNYKSVYGRPYRFIKMSFPSSIAPAFFTYTNSLIVNNTVIMPKFEGQYELYDQNARQIISSAMPGYNVVQAYCPPSLIDAGGAIHCLTHDINKDEVVRIAHPHFMSPRKVDEVVTFKADIWCKGSPSSVTLHLKRPREEDYTQYPMYPKGDLYHDTVDITADVLGEYKYYISASANSVWGYKPNNGSQGGYYTLSISDDFLQLKQLSEKKAVWAKDTNTYFPFSDVEKAIPLIGLYGLKIKKEGYEQGCCWKDDGGFSITGVNTFEWSGDVLVNEPLFTQGGFMIKRNGVPVFFISQNGSLAFGERMYTGMKL